MILKLLSNVLGTFFVPPASVDATPAPTPATPHLDTAPSPATRLTQVTNGTPSPAPADPLAESLIHYTLNGPFDVRRELSIIHEAVTVGQTKELRCSFHSDAFNRVIHANNNYPSLSNLVDNLFKHEFEITNCLNLIQILKYGPRIKRLLKNIKMESAYFDGLLQIYSQSRKISFMSAAQHLIGYFFRPDLIDASGRATLDQFVKKLSETTGFNL